MRRQRFTRWGLEGGLAVLAAGALIGVWAGGRTPAVEAQTARTFSGSFGGSGTFSNSTCTWNTTYSGTVTLTLTFGASGVTGTARHRGSYADRLTNGPAECGGDVNSFDVTVPVSGSAQALSWGFGHGDAGRVAVTASLIGNAIVGRGVTTDPEYAGSAIVPFTASEVGGGPSAPPASPTSAPTTAPASAPTAAPTAVRTAAPAASGAGPAAPNAGAGTSPSGAPSGNAPVGVAPNLPPVPAVPPPKDAGPTATVKRELCQAISGDAAVWQMIEDHVGEWTTEEMPSSVLAACVAQYRAQPWTGGGQLDSVKDEKGGQGNGPAPADNTPVKATLETVTPLFLRPGEKVPATVPTGGAPLGKGDAIITKGEPATVRFSDGSRIDLGPKTALIAADPEHKSLIQMRGRMFMDIRSRNWVIRVPDPRGMVSVAVRGTQFSTEVIEGGSVKVEVNEGTVEVTSAGTTVAVSAGSSIIVQPGQAPPTPKGSSGGTPVALYGGAAAFAVVVIAAGVLLLRRRRA